jgi:pimeloyl-ACP methyl ester carboxylesterase
MSLGSTIAYATDRIVRPVEGMHRAISRPWFAAVGLLGRPVQLVHDAISGVVYEAIRFGSAVIGKGIDARGGISQSTADTAQAVVNGLWGDALARDGHRLAMPMSLRDPKGAEIPSGGLPDKALPTATGRLVVLVHGLIKTDRCWRGTEAKPGLIRSLENRDDITPVAVRYNTGLPIAANGARLASLLEEVHSDWPVPIQSIALVGHSMGGLVVRSAHAAGIRAGHIWADHLSDIVTIGTPHRGAPLEKMVNFAASGIGVAPQTRPVAEFLNTRSQGIKNLRYGMTGHDSNPMPSPPTPPSEVKHHLVAGVVTSHPGHPIAAIVGDLMVRPASSTSIRQLDPIDVVVLGGVTHSELLYDPAVIDHVLGWLVPQS